MSHCGWRSKRVALFQGQKMRTALVLLHCDSNREVGAASKVYCIREKKNVTKKTEIG